LATNVPSNTFEDVYLPYGATYYYKVSAVNASGESALSSEISVLTKPGGNTKLTATTGDSQVVLSWTAVPTATSYRIFRDTLGGPGGGTNFVVTGATTFTDTGLVNGQQYWYEIDAINSGGENFGALSVATATPKAASGTENPTGAPMGVTASAGNGQVLLRWLPVSNATSYSVYRGPSAGSETLLSSGVASLTFRDTGLTNNSPYYYKVTAVNANGASIPSSEVSATPYVPSTPVLTVTSGKGQNVLTWTGTGSSFAIYRSSSSGAEKLLNSGVAGNTFTDAGLANGTTYYYKVQGLNVGGSGALSAEKSGTASGLAASPSTVNLSFGLPNEPVQTCSLYIPDTNRPINGALFLSKTSMGNNLKQVINKYNIAVINTANYAFVTSNNNATLLHTSDDPSHTVQVLDFRWYLLSAQRMQAALTAAAILVPAHPELQYTGVIMYGFSEGCPNVNLPLSTSAFSSRVLAVVQLSELDEDHYAPTAVMETSPHLLLSSSYTTDQYSALNQSNPDYTGDGVAALTYDVQGRGETTNEGAPLTIMDNVGVTHGGNPDNPFIRIWLDDVLSQRLPATVSTTTAVSLPSWQYNSAWAGTYDVSVTNNVPWGTSSIKGIQLINDNASPRSGYVDPRPSTWLPSQNMANTWLTYSTQAVAYWKLDEATGTSSYDTSPNAITGTQVNGPVFSTTTPEGITFPDAGSLSFNGTNQYVDMGNPAALPVGTTPRTICGWAKAGSTASGNRWIASYGTAGTSEAMAIGMNGTSLVAGAFQDDLTVANFWDTNWHFIALTYDGTTANLYADGYLVATAAKSWNLVAGHCYIGRQVSGAEYWNGLIDDVRIYNYALPASQVYSLGSGAIAYWTLDEAAGPYSHDSSSSGITGTWANSPTPSTSIPTGLPYADGGSLSFNGTNQYVDMGNPAALPSGTAPRTICGWAKAATTAGGYRWIASYGTAGTSKAMFIGMNGTTLDAGGYGNDLTVPNFWDTNWHFIALTYDGTTANLYADGNLVATGAKTWNLVPAHCYIGRQVSGSQYWNGLIDDVRIYDSALSPAEISDIFH
jgi:fibronectin type 3 domain-containing protein